MKNFIPFICLLFTISSISAQVNPINFEDGGNGASWTWTVFENDTNPPVEIIANPDATGANTSATVAKITALQTGQPWVGCESQIGSDIGNFTIDASNSTVKIMVWKSVISDVGLKLVRADFWALPEIKVANTVTEQWEEITFDISAWVGNEYDQIVFFPDFDGRASDNVVYFDNIDFGNGTVEPVDAPMIAAPTPTELQENVISMFSNAYTDVTVDTWATDWSVATYSELQIEGNDTKKYANLDYAGIEMVGANLLDASSMESFHIDVWTPNVTTFRVKLVDFGEDGAFEGGDDSEHEIIVEAHPQDTWVSHEISLDDFTGLTSFENIAQLILSGLPTGGTVYVDNVYFSRLSSSNAELNKNNFKLFPNPAQNQINISSDENIEQISVYDVAGKLMMSRNIQNNGATLDIAHLAKGMYTFVAIINDKTLTDKFIIIE
jgi:hypothetical protein